MNKRPTKAETRQELESKIQEFIKHGGAIQHVDSGASGLVEGAYHRNSFTFGHPKQERTPVPEALAAIDSRRRSKTESPTHAYSKRPRKKIIYDDFGEPVREIWVEE
ncbi:hypothetical protein [Neptunomonas concharum]|uniref:Transcriptional regulator SutA RNAP-binding domain-containing protein n=1 Tax=Neptunomonas concharum TaxID=1031538 RepID=A0A5P1R908_9GAMM|nr:hypothetical protein [Neptunomonas concharum]QEQ96110.1 hypothetical protein F0U83_04980 [Neptunomonas concharum]